MAASKLSDATLAGAVVSARLTLQAATARRRGFALGRPGARMQGVSARTQQKGLAPRDSLLIVVCGA